MFESTGTNPLVRSRLMVRVLLLIGLLTLTNGLMFAQGFSAAITGSVQDTSGAAVSGAMVTVKHLETGITRAAQADAGGNYSIPSLPVGAYEVTAEKMGFQREMRRGIDLAVGQEAEINLVLRVGSIDQQITVTEDAPLVNTTLSSTSGLIEESQVKDLPLNGRSFDQLITLNVGTSNNSINTLNNSSWNGFSVAGKRPETNRFLINGIDWIGGNGTWPVHHALRSQRAVARSGSGARVQSRVRHLRRRVRQARRRHGQHRDRLRDQSMARRRIRVSAQQRFRRQELLRSNHRYATLQA